MVDLQAILAIVTLPSITLLGCVTAYIYCEQKGLKNSQKFLTKFFPNRTPRFYFRSDFVLSAIIGTCIGIILYSPQTGYQALAAGVGWTAAFSLLKSEKVSTEASRDSAR